MFKLYKEIAGPKRYRHPLHVPMLRRMGRRILVALFGRVNALGVPLAQGCLMPTACAPPEGPQPAFSDEALGRLALRNLVSIADQTPKPNKYLGEIVDDPRHANRSRRGLVGNLAKRVMKRG